MRRYICFPVNRAESEEIIGDAVVISILPALIGNAVAFGFCWLGLFDMPPLWFVAITFAGTYVLGVVFRILFLTRRLNIAKTRTAERLTAKERRS